MRPTAGKTASTQMRGARPGTSISSWVSGPGKALRCGSTRRSIKVSDSVAPLEWLVSRVRRLTRWAPLIRMRGYRECSCGKRLISAATLRRSKSAANQFAGSQTADRLVITVGKFSVVDIFDANKYAHDPRADFLNWTVVDTGAFDYAADAWAFTYGSAVEW